MQLTVDGTVATFFDGCERWLVSFQELVLAAASAPAGPVRDAAGRKAFESAIFFLDDARLRLLDMIRPGLDVAHQSLLRAEDALGLDPGRWCAHASPGASRAVIAAMADRWRPSLRAAIDRIALARDKQRPCSALARDTMGMMNDAKNALLRALATDVAAWDARCQAISAATFSPAPPRDEGGDGGDGIEPGGVPGPGGEDALRSYLSRARAALRSTVASAGSAAGTGDATSLALNGYRAASLAADIAIATIQHAVPPAGRPSLADRLASLASSTGIAGIPSRDDATFLATLRDEAAAKGPGSIDPPAVPRARAVVDATLRALACFTGVPPAPGIT